MGSGKSHIGVIGLAVMGENLVLNMADKGFTVSVFNRTTARVDEFTAGRAAGKSVVGTHSIAEMVQSLAKPRTVMTMVKAGKPVDELISQLAPLMEPGDVIMDGGNSNYQDTARRVEHLAALGIHFVGTGVSGGEEGALLGPPSCRAARLTRGPSCVRCCRASPRARPTARRAARGSAVAARATM